MGISPRYVRRLFQEETGSFSAYVLDERLDRAHCLLLHPWLVPRTIAATAYACGLGDLSSFNSTFRRRLGITPSDSDRKSTRLNSSHTCAFRMPVFAWKNKTAY